MTYIELTKGFRTIIDDEDYERINKFKWHSAVDLRAKKHLKVYARRVEYLVGNSRKVRRCKVIGMHNFILNPPVGYIADHINGDTLDNRRINLRICTDLDNRHNRKKYNTTKSKYKGVTYKTGECKHSRKGYIAPKPWTARITIGNKLRTIGYYGTENEAALAYNRIAKENWGEFARLNEIEPTT